MGRPVKLISVADLSGRHCIALEEAEPLHREILVALHRGCDVQVDFTGVETLASSFLNVAIGRLFGCLPRELLEASVGWVGLDPADERVLRLVIRNAMEYYRQNPQQRRVHQQILSELA